eukprot:1334619-Rhodomonas_salina.2
MFIEAEAVPVESEGKVARERVAVGHRRAEGGAEQGHSLLIVVAFERNLCLHPRQPCVHHVHRHRRPSGGMALQALNLLARSTLFMENCVWLLL